MQKRIIINDSIPEVKESNAFISLTKKKSITANSKNATQIPGTIFLIEFLGNAK